MSDVAFTQSGKKVSISDTAQNADLDDHATEGFPGLDYTRITGVGSIGETGTSTNMLSYDTMDEDVVRKQKGLSDGGDPALEVRRIAADAGQVAVRAAAKTKDAYAFKVEMQDGSVQYLRAIVAGPTRPGGRNEDFELEVYTLGVTQEEVIVDPV